MSLGTYSPSYYRSLMRAANYSPAGKEMLFTYLGSLTERQTQSLYMSRFEHSHPDSSGRVFWEQRESHRLSLDKIKAGYDTVESLVKKTGALLDLLTDEHVKLHADPRKVELVRLMRLFMQGRKSNSKGEYRLGNLSCFDTSMGITIRLFLPENKDREPEHDLVYNTTSDYKFKDEHNLKRAPLVEANFRPDLADEALDLLRQVLVLETLANV